MLKPEAKYLASSAFMLNSQAVFLPLQAGLLHLSAFSLVRQRIFLSRQPARDDTLAA
jgi:hypothetical protein